MTLYKIFFRIKRDF